MNNSIWKGQAFSVSHADGSGLQKAISKAVCVLFEYRDLGIAAAQAGRILHMLLERFLDVIQSQTGMFMI